MIAMQRRPSIVVLDLDECKAHLQLVEQLVRMPMPCGVLALTSSQCEEFVRAVYAAGASAVLVKSQWRSDTLLESVQRVLLGDVWINRKLLHKFLLPQTEGKAAEQAIESDAFPQEHVLTCREREVVRALARGYRNRRIGSELGISEATVRRHLTTIYGKLRVENRYELLLYVHTMRMEQSQSKKVLAAR